MIDGEFKHIDHSSSLREAFDAWQPEFQEDQVWEQLTDSLDVEAVWSKLDDSLDLEQVWTRLDDSLEQVIPIVRFPYGKAVALLAVFVFTGVLWLRDSLPNEVKPTWRTSLHTEQVRASSGEGTTMDRLVRKENNQLVMPKRSNVEVALVEKNVLQPVSDLPNEMMANESARNPLLFVDSLGLKSLTFFDLSGSHSNVVQRSLGDSKPTHTARKWHWEVQSGMNVTAIQIEKPRALSVFIPGVGAQFGLAVQYQYRRNRVSVGVEFAQQSMRENRYINGKYGSIIHSRYQYSLGIGMARMILPNVELQGSGVVALPYRTLSTRDDVVVGLPRAAVEYGGQIGLGYWFTPRINASLSYRWTKTNQPAVDWSQTRVGLLSLRYSF